MEARIRCIALVVTLAVAALGAAAHAQAGEVLAIGVQPEMSAACAVSQEQCTVDCLGRGEQGEMVACLMACDNRAARCAGDERPTLSSEWYTELFGNGLSFKSGACHDTTPCPSQYASCGSWSGYTNCDAPYCGVYRFCGSGCGEPLCFGEATRQNQERYRVCFNSSGQSCTEWQRTSQVVTCGC